MSTALRLFGRLDILVNMPASPSLCAPFSHVRLRRLATKPYEISGLMTISKSLFSILLISFPPYPSVNRLNKTPANTSMKCLQMPRWRLTNKDISSAFFDADLKGTAEKLVIGGWPANLELDETDAAFALDSYVELLSETDLSRVSGVKRDPVKIRRVLQSLARNTATECSLSRIAVDAGGADGALSENTVSSYLEALDRLMIIYDLKAWRPHIRSRARMRGAVKRHFSDPSLAASILGMDSARLLSDLQYMGFLFESQVIHDLRIYAGVAGAGIFHYRDSNGIEADAILENKDGSWAAFEIKLGIGGADQGASSLLRFRETIDIEKTGKHLAMTVITGSGFAHKRKDGVYVVPIQTLRP